MLPTRRASLEDCDEVDHTRASPGRPGRLSLAHRAVRRQAGGVHLRPVGSGRGRSEEAGRDPVRHQGRRARASRAGVQLRRVRAQVRARQRCRDGLHGQGHPRRRHRGQDHSAGVAGGGGDPRRDPAPPLPGRPEAARGLAAAPRRALRVLREQGQGHRLSADSRPPLSLAQIAGYFLRLGTLGFGGPIALAGYMQRDLVERLGWITQEEYLEGLAVSQTLPGPLAAQLAMWLGYVRRGFWGAGAAAVPFILPPFIIVTVVAALYVAFRGTTVIQALFYGVGPAVIALILRGAWKIVGVTVKADSRLWAIFVVIGIATFVVRS